MGTIVLGEIVIDEVCNKYRENLEERASKAKRAIRDLNDMLFTHYTVWDTSQGPAPTGDSL